MEATCCAATAPTATAMRAPVVKRGAKRLTKKALQCSADAGRNISGRCRGPQHGFHNPPDSVSIRKLRRQREIDTQLVHQPQLSFMLLDKLFDPRPVVIAEHDEFALDVDCGN